MFVMRSCVNDSSCIYVCGELVSQCCDANVVLDVFSASAVSLCLMSINTGKVHLLIGCLS